MNAPQISSQSAIRLSLIAALAGAIACLWMSWCEFPSFAWNEVRLAPAFALRHGINPYPPLGGGPLSTWIYGPVGIVINLPATFAASPVGALHAASVINALVILLPLAVIFFNAEELCARGPAVPWLALALATLLLPRLNFALQVADHSAIAFGLLSCWCLARVPVLSTARLATAAAFCALAIWSKQIAAFLVLAQVGFLLLGRDRVAAVRYVAWVAVFGALALAVAGWKFGFANLWLNLVAIPGRLPWAELPARLAMRPWSLVAQVLIPSLGLGLLWRTRCWPRRDRESGRFFQLATLAFVAMLPVGLAGFFKIGGDTNLLHSWDYLLPGALLAWLAADRVSLTAPARLLAATAGALALHGHEFVALPVRPFTGQFEAATRLTAAYPHALWFPQNPLITFYADGELWHSEDGVLTRYLAGYGLREPDFRRHLPPKLQGVAYAAIVEFPFALPLLAEFSHETRLPYWTLHTRPPAPLAKP